MKKTILLLTVLALGAIGMACGEAGTGISHPSENAPTANVTCYSGGQKILELQNARITRDTYSGGVRSTFEANGHLYSTFSQECILEGK